MFNPQTGAAETAGSGCVGLGEGLEDLLLFGGGNADAGIANRDPEFERIAGAAVLYAHRDLAGLGKFDCVIEQIGQHLP